MNILLILTYLFFIGSVSGWVLEVFFRKFFSDSNPNHKWINPGFCTGPYLPIYGVGLCILYLLALLGGEIGLNDTVKGRGLLFALIAVSMTLIEYIGGIILLKAANLRLWDYNRLWGNIDGLICPLFSLIWAFLGAIYYFEIHEHILVAINWLAENLAFSFVVGFFFGIFTIDLVNSAQLASKISKYAEELDLVIKFETLKMHLRETRKQASETVRFLFPFRTVRSIPELLSEAHDAIEKRRSPRRDVGQ